MESANRAPAKAGTPNRQRFMVPKHAQKRMAALHDFVFLRSISEIYFGPNPMATSIAQPSVTRLLRHETVLAVMLALEWLYFYAVSPRFGTVDNTFDIVRHSVEVGLLA